MPNCKYCGQKAGFFSFKHKECDETHTEALRRLPAMAIELVTAGTSLAEAERQLTAEIQRGFVQREPKNYLVTAWEGMLDRYLDDGVLTEEEDAHLQVCIQTYNLVPSEFQAAWLKRCKAIVLREVLNGNIPEKPPGINFVGVPVVLGKGERIVWSWPGTRAFQEKVKRSFVGNSSGMSFRVAKGVYYRTSAFKGHPIEERYHEDLGVGALTITNKNIVWTGSKAIKVSLKKIVSVQGYSDGVGLQLEGVRAKPVIFQAGKGEGWFLTNLAENLPGLI